MSIKLLDCTLRDGGHVNEANFGYNKIKEIIFALASSKLDVIELGFLKNGRFSKDQSIYNIMEEVYPMLPDNQDHQEYSLMIRPDWYDIQKLTYCNNQVKHIRFAFYYKDIDLTKRYSEYAKEKGYFITLNPVNVMGYDEHELVDLLYEINKLNPYGVTIVDTFGSMMKDDLIRIYNLFENNLSKSVQIGLHLHENLALAYSLAQEFIEIRSKDRAICIDGSLAGMGRIPGNLCIELIMDYVNSRFNTSYNLVPVLNAIGKNILPIKSIIPWGFSDAYFLTAKYKIHRSYAEYFLKSKKIDLDDMKLIFEQINAKEFMNEFNKSYADGILEQMILERKIIK